MSVYKFDFRLTNIPAELHTLKTYRDVLASSYDDMVKVAVEQVESDWDMEDPGERQAAMQLSDQVEREELPRLVWGAFIVTAHAVFEAAVIEIADFLRSARGIPLRIVEIKGDLGTQTKRYYKDVLQFSFVDFGGEPWERIVRLGHVRDALTHSAGRLDMVPKHKQDALKKIIAQGIGVSVPGGNYLVVNEKFATASLDAIERVLREAVDRAREEADRLKQD